MNSPVVRLFRFALTSAVLAQVVFAQQDTDPDFHPTVEKPAFTAKHPRILFDAAHHNFHTAKGRYKPLADLLAADGCEVKANNEKFTRETLAAGDILVIANALGAEGLANPDAHKPAFTDAECDVVRDWVRAGGSLLLVTDHFPTGEAAEILGRRFDVDMSKGQSPQFVLTREAGRVVDHPVTLGRDESERIAKVGTFTGQTLKGPPGSVAFLRVPDRATENIPRKKNGDENATEKVSSTGRAQGIALTLGKGRVIVLGEAAMLSAQVIGPQKRPMGMNVPGLDNRRLALNIIHWLAGILPESSPKPTSRPASGD